MIVVKTEVIIGNYIIELIEKGIFQFTIEDLHKLDNVLSLRVAKMDYHYKPLVFHIYDFLEKYPSFVTSKDDTVYIKKEAVKDKELVIRYFRIGCPKNLVAEIIKVTKEVIGKL